MVSESAGGPPLPLLLLLLPAPFDALPPLPLDPGRQRVSFDCAAEEEEGPGRKRRAKTKLASLQQKSISR